MGHGDFGRYGGTVRARRAPLGVAYTSESIIGTRFTGHLVREVQLGEYRAVQPVVTGEAYITGIQQFVVDPRDPVKYGFSVGKNAQR